MEPLKRSIYDVLETLINRVVWATEAEKIEAITTINHLRKVGGLGYGATLGVCPHPTEARSTRYKGTTYIKTSMAYCQECGADIP